MSPTRLREIAERMETLCIENRQLEDNSFHSETLRTDPCDGCIAAARELREFADDCDKALNALELEKTPCSPSAKPN